MDVDEVDLYSVDKYGKELTGFSSKTSLTMRVLHHDCSNLGNPFTFLFFGLIGHVDELKLSSITSHDVEIRSGVGVVGLIGCDGQGAARLGATHWSGKPLSLYL